MPTHLFNAYFESLDGATLAGPVTMDKDEYLFVNKNTADDIYFNLKKTTDGWIFSGGPVTHSVPQTYIDAVGAQIDKFHQGI
ncbi:hypothetical protein [Mucilaginibacter polytrichastri]|uniref:Uncharacterized protein n=1 Tax=Mucilaginibacter polytrichastri TaxID=1302689 RepID=A0A1Q5ZV36_9SPHI|nr:hypothetical protein [Mucilaginibacter polytrichastri]OKS85593.1 hypothetical protein RG47T_1039 [Mucilaginibacter polytrichastri]SFS36031.1 hypothetical protein SAMN04487890_10163 [Mucilaginibacter polytrichastri]